MQIVFVHIPKTAGTAVREALFRARPEAANLCDYGADHPATNELVKQLIYSPGSGPNQLRTVLAPTPAWTLAGQRGKGVKVADFGLAKWMELMD